MNSKLTIATVIIIAITLGLVFLPAQAQNQVAENPATAKAEAKKWQHLALSHDARKKFGNTELARNINKLGEEGWEMLNVLNFQEEGTTIKTVYYFKRPL
ncbi:MAG: hypothetical protein ABF381_10505 [Akkermansiaceae bacterium]